MKWHIKKWHRILSGAILFFNIISIKQLFPNINDFCSIRKTKISINRFRKSFLQYMQLSAENDGISRNNLVESEVVRRIKLQVYRK